MVIKNLVEYNIKVIKAYALVIALEKHFKVFGGQYDYDEIHCAIKAISVMLPELVEIMKEMKEELHEE